MTTSSGPAATTRGSILRSASVGCSGSQAFAHAEPGELPPYGSDGGQRNSTSGWQSSKTRSESRRSIALKISSITWTFSLLLMICLLPKQVHDGFVRGPNQQIHIGRRAFLGRDVPTDHGERRLDHGVGDHPDGTHVVPAAQAPAEGAELRFNLLRELSCPAAERGRPPAANEVLAPVEQEQSGLPRVLAHPLRHVERRLQPGVPRSSAGEPLEERVLEGSGGAKPHRGEQHIPGGESVVDRAGWRPKGARDGSDRGTGRAMRRRQPAR